MEEILVKYGYEANEVPFLLQEKKKKLDYLKSSNKMKYRGALTTRAKYLLDEIKDLSFLSKIIRHSSGKGG